MTCGACSWLGAILGAHLVLQTVAMLETTAIRAGWFVAFMPVVISLGAQLVLRERMRGFGWLGVALATLGVLVLASARPEDLAAAGRGDLMLFVSCFTWAAYTLLAGPLVRRQRRAGRHGLGHARGDAALPGARRVARASRSRSPTRRRGPCSCCSACCPAGPRSWPSGRAVATLGAQRTAAFLYVQPFVTLVGARALLDEPFTLWRTGGGAGRPSSASRSSSAAKRGLA